MVDVNREVKFFKYSKKQQFFGGGSGRGVGLVGQVGCERRIEVFVKIPKKNIFFFFLGGGGGVGSRGGGSGWGGVRVDVNEELNFL